MMKKTIFVVILSIVIFSQYAAAQGAYNSVVIVCDIDDTYKITNTTSKFNSLINALFSSRTFGGMNELFFGMNARGAQIYFLSNSPKILKRRINKLLRENQIEFGGLFLRKVGEDGISHKITVLTSLIDTCSRQSFILIGDDSENDPLIYDSIKHMYPEKVEAIYIHHIKGKNALPYYRFYSAVDIAYYESIVGRMNDVGMEKILEAVMASELHSVFPDYIVFDEKLILSDVAGCFERHCLSKNKTIEWLIDCWYKQ